MCVCVTSVLCGTFCFPALHLAHHSHFQALLWPFQSDTAAAACCIQSLLSAPRPCGEDKEQCCSSKLLRKKIGFLVQNAQTHHLNLQYSTVITFSNPVLIHLLQHIFPYSIFSVAHYNSMKSCTATGLFGSIFFLWLRLAPVTAPQNTHFGPGYIWDLPVGQTMANHGLPPLPGLLLFDPATWVTHGFCHGSTGLAFRFASCSRLRILRFQRPKGSQRNAKNSKGSII